jgi:peptidyl-prolyl cis-trans isomerase B (cyclophilin B)
MIDTLVLPRIKNFWAKDNRERLIEGFTNDTLAFNIYEINRRIIMKKLILTILLALVLSGCSLGGNQAEETTPLTNAGSDIINETGEPMTEPTTLPEPTESTDSASAAKNDIKEYTEAVIKTSKGDITVKLYPDSAPKTVANFGTKATNDYYKNLTFHRVENWVIQGGDPLGTGTGGGSMPTELSQVPFKEGSLGVARGGDIKISNDSQFFICTKDCSWLSGQYTNFGEVLEGMEIAKKIAIGDKILGITLQ